MADNSVILNTELRVDETKLRQSLQRIEQQLKFRGPFGDMAVNTTRFTHELDRATQRVITLGTAFQILSTASRTLHEIARSTVEVEKALTDINVIFRLTNDNLSKFSGKLFGIARETAQSFDEVAKAATEFARQGMSVQKTQDAVRASMILSRDANLDVVTTIKALTAAVNGFSKEGLTHIQVANKIAAADAAFAVSSKDLQEALIRVGSAASDAGVSFDELLALITSAQQITARGGAVISGAFNTIFTRINRRETLDALESLQKGMTQVGGVTLPTIKILENFAKVYDGLTGSVKAQAAELVGGVRQLNTLKASLADLSKETGVYRQNLATLATARDQAEQRNLARNYTYDAQLKQLKETGREIGANIGTIGFGNQIKGVIGGLNENYITQSLRNTGDLTNESFGAEVGRTFIKGFGGAVMFGLTPLIGGVLFQLSKNVFGNLFRDIKDITLLKNESRDIAQLQQQINALYQAGGAPLQQQLALMTDLTRQAAVFASLLRSAQGGVAIDSRAIALTLTNQGIRPVRRAAEGYIPMGEEMGAIARGVGGASPSSQAIFLPHFDRGNGKKGIVANTSEFIVPNLAGGSAIFNREMIRKYGLPPGSTPVASEGYVPHASFGWMLGMPAYNSPYDYPQKMLKNPSALYTPATGFPVAQGGGLGHGIVSTAPIIAGGVFPASSGQGFGQFLDSSASGSYAKLIMATKIGVAQNILNAIAAAEMKAAQEAAQKVAAQEEWWKRNIFRGGVNAYGESAPSEPESAVPDMPSDPRGGIDTTYLSRKARESAEKTAAAVRQAQDKRLIWLGKRDVARTDFAYQRAMARYGAGQNITEASGALIQRELLREGMGKAQEFLGPGARAGAVSGWASNYAAVRMAELNASRVTAINNTTSNSLWSRVAGKMTPTAAMMLGIGLPMVGSNINDRPGGTLGGMFFGGLSGALNMAGTGAMTGFMLGKAPGALIGAGIGAVAGGTYGAISRSSKSTEELVTELDQAAKRFDAEGEALLSVIRLQEEISQETARGNTTQANLLRREQGIAAGNINDPVYRNFLASNLNNPNALTEAIRLRTNRTTTTALGNTLMTGIQNIRSTTWNETLYGMGIDTREGQPREAAVASIKSVLHTMSDQELNALSKIKNPQAALQIVGRKAGLSDKQISEMSYGFYEYGGNVLLDAINSVRRNPMARRIAQGGIAGRPEFGLNEISTIAHGYNLSAMGTEVNAMATNQLRQARQQMRMQGPMTNMERLRAEENNALSNLSFERQVGTANLFAGGRASIVNALKAAGVRDQEAYNMVAGLTNMESFTAFGGKASKGGFAGVSTVHGEKIQEAVRTMDLAFNKLMMTEQAMVPVIMKIYEEKRKQLESEKTYTTIIERTTKTAQDEDAMIAARAQASVGLMGSSAVSGAQIESGVMGGAALFGRRGNAAGSFMGGFRAHFAGLKQDMYQFAEIGNNVARSLSDGFGNAFGNFVTGAQQAKDAFRSFAIGVLGDASRMLGSKAIQGIFGATMGNVSMGSVGIAGAAGGTVPALLTGGEFWVGPNAAKRIGYSTLRQLNGYAEGGLVRGGSGVRDDVPARLPPGSFVVRRGATERLGADYLQALVNGQVQHRWIGGALMGALLGGGLGYAVGGKKGAIGGALLGGIGGGLMTRSGPQIGWNESGQALYSAVPDALSKGATLSIGLGAATGLGMLAAGINDPSPYSPPSYSATEAYQRQLFANNRFAYLSPNSGGGYSLASWGSAPPTRRFSEGGSVDNLIIPGPSNNQSSAVSVKIEINNNGQVSSKSESGGNGGGAFGADFGTKLEKAIRPIVQDELVRQSRNDGFFTQRSRYVTS